MIGSEGQQACGIIGSDMWNNNKITWKDKTNVWQSKTNIWYLLCAWPYCEMLGKYI